MRMQLSITIVALLTAVAVSIALVVLGAPAPEDPISKGAGAVPVEDAEDYAYLIKEYQGRLAVYVRGSSDPDLVFDVYVQSLPELDRQQLQNGVAAQDYAELVGLIEDYTS